MIQKKRRSYLLPIILAATALLLLILFFAVINPLLGEKEETPGITVGEGEGILLNRGTLYPPIRREAMISITVHNEKGTYRFARLPKEGKPVSVTDEFFLYKEKGDEFVLCETAYDKERLSELVVATGSFYYLRNLKTEPELEGKTLNLADYGLSAADDPAWFEIETFKDGKVRVYVGDAAVTDDGYYVYVEGRGTAENPVVYVSSSTLVGETALANLASYADPTLTSPITQYEYYYSKDFTFWRPAAPGYRITANDTVRYRYYEVIDGVATEPADASTDMRTAIDEVKQAFLGKQVGADPFTFTIQYPERPTDESKVEESLKDYYGKTVEYHIEEIKTIDELYIMLDFLNPSERSKFYTGVAYAITAPADKTVFHPSSNNFMSVLEKIGNLVGTEAVDVGVDAELIEKYGLLNYRIHYRMPIALSYKENSDDIVVAEDKYLEIDLYISKKQEDGSYYVTSIFPGTDVVARVDGETLSFLERSDRWWFNDTMYSVNINTATKLEVDFDYNDADVSYSFDLSHNLSDSGKYSLATVKETTSGTWIGVNAFKNFYMHLVTMYYSGEYKEDSSVPKEEVLADRSVLTLRVTVRDDAVYEYKFYPYSERHVLVSVAKEGDAEGAFFYVLASEVEKIYRDIGVLLDGDVPNPEKQY